MKFLALMFSEGDGSPSTMRALSALIALVVLGCWAFVTIEKRELQPISMEQMGLILGALGIKAWQRGKESYADGAKGPSSGSGDGVEITPSASPSRTGQ